ncbi:MAG: NnrS family protein [Psychromonas sp.]|nr:NnrS family protein [Alteromonadales bacterium]MCP5077236.1 NnrS family protein [Psychromonas sp.]
MMNINDPSNRESAKKSLAFFEFAFRPFFLLASIFSIISLITWNGLLGGNITVNLYGGSLWWHSHEMLFGFTAAVIVGFLLTAVQNWSGVRSLNGKGLAGLVLIWLAARVAFFFPELLPHTIIVVIDMAFLPLSAIALAYPIIKVKLWRNLMFIPILLTMTITNAITHYSVASGDYILMSSATTFMVLLVTLVMCIMGGRVFPMFTANGTRTPRVDAIPTLEKLSVISILLAVISGAGFIELPKIVVASIFVFASVVHAIRVFRWKFSVTLKTPLVWSLHISYWCIAIGLLLFGLSEITTVVSHSQAIHTLTVGAMATMILGMISRVSLGHTGRMIVVGKTMTVAFIAIILAAIIRVFGFYFIDNYNHVLTLAVLFWTIGFGCFVALYFPILIKPRAN